MVKEEEEGVEDECSRSHFHGRSTVMVKEEEGVEEEMFSKLSSFVGSLRLIFEFSRRFEIN